MASDAERMKAHREKMREEAAALETDLDRLKRVLQRLGSTGVFLPVSLANFTGRDTLTGLVKHLEFIATERGR